MVRVQTALLTLAALASSSSCFKPSLGDGVLKCGAEGLCPEGYVCRDNLCYRGHALDDLSVTMSGDLSRRDGQPAPDSDLAGQQVDMTDNGGCSSGVFRVCLGTTTSATCSNGIPVADRVCPPGSFCANGRCQPPAGGIACVRNIDCTTGTVCDGYADTGALHGVCTQPIPGSTGGQSATCPAPGYDSFCEDGLCARSGQGAVVCAFACRVAADCKVAAGQTATCQTIAAPTTLEGVALTASVCVVH